MSFISGPRVRSLALVVALIVTATPAHSQGWREFQAGALAVASRPAFGGLAIGLGLRDRGRTRLSLQVAGGAFDEGTAAGRIEAVWNFLLDPQRTTGVAIYGGGGAALSTLRGGRLRGSVLVLLGLENRPGSRSSRFVEIGVGGGARIAAGFRSRVRLPLR